MEYTYIHNHQSQFLEWFGGDKFVSTTLPEISENMDYKRVPITSGDRNVGQFPYYGASGIVDYIDNYIFDEPLLLVSEDGANLKDRVTPIAFIAEGKYWVNNHAHVLKFTNFANMTYICHFFNFTNIEKYLTGMAQPKLNQAQLNTIKIPWPPVKMQEQFAALVEQADKSKFDGFKSQFIEWFGNPFLSPKNGESVSITDVADIVLGTTPNSKIKEYWDGELKWITPAEIEEESFIISDTVRHITEDGRNSANLTLLPVGSVLFSTRAPIGKVAIAGEEMYCNQGFKNFICKPELNNVFLYYTLRLNKEYLVSLGTGTTFKELSKKIVESIKISVPAKEQQEQFERVFRQSDKSKYYEINET